MNSATNLEANDSQQAGTLGRGRKVVVVGAGFSGLSAAFHLERAGFKVEIHEKENRAGGLISTRKTPDGLIETAANGFLNSYLVEDLFETVGCEMIGTKSDARRRFIYRSGEFRRWPLGIAASFQVGWFLIRYLLSKELIAPRKGETTHEWGHRVLGAEATQFLLETGLQGIYAGDSDRMSASLILGRFFGLSPNAGGAGSVVEQNSSSNNGFKSQSSHSASASSMAAKAGKRKLRFHGTVSAPEGMGELIEKIESYLRSRGVVIHYGSEYQMTESPRDHVVVVAGSAHQAADVIRAVMPEKARKLRSIEISPVVTTTAFFEITHEGSRGFGALFPREEKRLALGVLKNNFIFRGRAQKLHSETWILGGATGSQEILNATDQEIVNRIENERASIFGLREKAKSYSVTSWKKAIPHYTTELERTLESIDPIEKNIVLVGNYLGRIGLAKILEQASELPFELDKKCQW